MVVRRSSNKNVLFQFQYIYRWFPKESWVFFIGFSLRMSIYGGETIKESAKRLETAPIDIICATPGRLIALLDETKLPGCTGEMAMMARKMAAVDEFLTFWPPNGLRFGRFTSRSGIPRVSSLDSSHWQGFIFADGGSKNQVGDGQEKQCQTGRFLHYISGI